LRNESIRLFQVTKPGLFTTIQDLGRYGYLRYGVPISGAMDQFSLVVANLLVGNDVNAACLETTLIGPELQVLREAQIAITGGDCSPKINGETVPMWQMSTVQEGDVVSFGRMQSGCRAYLSTRGGIDTPIILRSWSTYARGKFGGMDGRPLKTGDVIEGFSASPLNIEFSMPEEFVPHFISPFKVDAIPGPQVDMFTEDGVETFFSNPYTVTSESDRMGYRLEGPHIEHEGKADIISDALLPGAIQVPKSGKPIVIMRDAQTTGGYPKIAVVISSDVSMLGQAKPNDKVEFSRITLVEAHWKLQEYRKLVENLSNVFLKGLQQGKS
jgi:biotin-dependent carboxylase-like uncharacterized protein